MPASGRPPRPGPHVGYRISWARGCGFGVTVVPGVAAGEPGPRTCQSLGGRLSGATCAMAVYGQGHGGLFTTHVHLTINSHIAVPRCFSRTSSLKVTCVTYYPGLSDWLFDIRRDVHRRADGHLRAVGICRSEGMHLVLAKAYRHCLVHGEPTQIPH
jgi:hypothetical protein